MTDISTIGDTYIDPVISTSVPTKNTYYPLGKEIKNTKESIAYSLNLSIQRSKYRKEIISYIRRKMSEYKINEMYDFFISDKFDDSIKSHILKLLTQRDPASFQI